LATRNGQAVGWLPEYSLLRERVKHALKPSSIRVIVATTSREACPRNASPHLVILKELLDF
jgi:hypothetical protein